jgi:hypothetical protein
MIDEPSQQMCGLLKSIARLNRQMTSLVEDAQQAIETLNMATVAIATNRRLIQEKESAIVDLSARLRLGIGSKFGRKSEEYRIVNQTSKRGKNTKPTEQPAATSAFAIVN